MGTGISTDRRKATDVPVTPRRHTAEAGLNFQDTAQTARQEFGTTVRDELVGHADGTGTNSITMTPVLPFQSHLLMLEEMSRLGPPFPERTKTVFGELKFKTEFIFTVAGIGPDDPLAQAIILRLDHELLRKEVEFGRPAPSPFRGGISISFTGKLDLRRLAERAYKRTRREIERMQDLGLDRDLMFKITRSCLGQAAHGRPMARHVSEQGELERLIEALVDLDRVDAVFALLRGEASGLPIAVTFSKWGWDRDSFPANDETRLRQFSAENCCRLAKGGIAQLAIAGRIVLRELVTKDYDSHRIKDYQYRVFKRIAIEAGRVLEGTRWKFLQNLLDLPDIHRGDLFRNAKARCLLLEVGGLVELREVFDAIYNHYTEIWLGTRETLKGQSLIPKNTWGSEQFSIQAKTVLSESNIKELFALAEAACVIEREEEAIAVLQFLAPRPELSEEEKRRLRNLCVYVDMTVRFSLDPVQREKFDEVADRTTAIIAATRATSDSPGDETGREPRV
jgi:hypothetical protein